MLRKLFLVFSLAISAAPSHAGGSMAPDVKIIVVNPSRTVQRIDQIYQMNKDRKAAAREAAKAAKAAEKEAARAAKEADKAYAKKLAAQAKARKK
jgi:hypothetical protein